MHRAAFLPLTDTRKPASSTFLVLRERNPSLLQSDTLHFAPFANKSPAQKEKSQKSDAETKKSKKSEKSNTSKTNLSVIMDESKATKYINDAKVITVQDLARQTETKISVANSFLQKLFNDGAVKRVGGFSGHHLYKSVSGK